MNVTKCRFHVGATSARDFPKDDLPEIAFLGRSNVGKSMLINRLLGVRGLARTSKTPGRTRAINFFRINDRFYLVDLPGYGYARVSKHLREQWRGLVEEYLSRPGRPAVGIHLMDARREPSQEDLELREWFGAREKPQYIVLTKIDKLSGNARTAAFGLCARRLGLAPGERPGVVSALSGEGISALWRVIDGACETPRSRPVTVPSSEAGGIFDIHGSASSRSDTGRRSRMQDQPK
jgi:GTP-binding protein